MLHQWEASFWFINRSLESKLASLAVPDMLWVTVQTNFFLATSLSGFDEQNPLKPRKDLHSRMSMVTTENL